MLAKFLDTAHVTLDLCVASRKRLFEEFATMVTYSSEVQDGETKAQTRDRVFTTLLERERLGCTAIGNGIALPHGRLENLEQPVVAIARLQVPIDYDSPDQVPVWLAVCLLVPIEANNVHLDLLATLASRFTDDAFITEIRMAESKRELYRIFSSI